MTCQPASTFIWFLGAFLSGSVPFGLLLMKLAGKGDVRASGSGNIGATNVMRVGGKGLGIATLLLDAAKGFLPVFLARQAGMGPALLGFVALAAMCGHVFTPWLKFKGGKGVATALGGVLAYHAAMVLPALGVFLALVLIFRYISLGSIMAALTLILTACGLFGAWFILPVPAAECGARWAVLAWVVLGGMVIVKHHQNIGRLLKGTESRFWGKKN
jgi:glycerol-3-phosphate acyltransferase PlsY